MEYNFKINLFKNNILQEYSSHNINTNSLDELNISVLPKTYGFFENDVKIQSPHIGGGQLFVGAHSYINDGGYLRGNIAIGRYCSIGRRVTIGAGMHSMAGLSTSPHLRGVKSTAYSENEQNNVHISSRVNNVIIGHDVWIGDGAIILPGVTIGNGCVVGSNSVVTKDLPDYSIFGGVPAKKISSRFEVEVINKLNRSKWWDSSKEQLNQYPMSNIYQFIESYRYDNYIYPTFFYSKDNAPEIFNFKAELGIITYKKEHEMLKKLLSSIALRLTEKNTSICIISQDNVNLDDIISPFKNTLPNLSWNSASNLSIDGLEKCNGWQQQQLLKLYLSSISKFNFTILIDSKHYFIRDFSISEFYEKDGRAVMPIGSQESHLGSNRGNAYISCAEYFNTDYRYHIKNTLPTVTPFVFINEITRNIISTVEAKEEENFYSFFRANINKYTEFYFYSSYIHSQYDISNLYRPTKNHDFIFWSKQDIYNKNLSELISKGQTRSVAFHNRCIDDIINSDESEKIKLISMLPYGYTLDV